MPYRAIAFLSLFLVNSLFGQTVSSDSSFLATAQQQAIHAYEDALSDKSHLYNGHEYIQHDYRIKVHPYFATDSVQLGSVTYNGIVYHDVLMLYDVVRDELALKMPETIFRIRPHSQQISSFSLGPYQFARIVGDSAAGVRTGFYQVLYGGGIQVLAKRIKTVHEDITGGFYKADYLVKDRYFIVKEGVYHEVKKKRSVLALFPGQTAPLKKYLRANRIKFNQQREQAITAIVQQYEKLTH